MNERVNVNNHQQLLWQRFILIVVSTKISYDHYKPLDTAGGPLHHSLMYYAGCIPLFCSIILYFHLNQRYMARKDDWFSVFGYKDWWLGRIFTLYMWRAYRFKYISESNLVRYRNNYGLLFAYSILSGLENKTKKTLSLNSIQTWYILYQIIYDASIKSRNAMVYMQMTLADAAHQ